MVGFVTLGAGLHKREVPVYDGAGWAPDVLKLPRADRRVWVLAESVWGKERVVRRVTAHELLSLWDYEGKWESRRWSVEAMEGILTSRLKSPPAKILRAVAIPAFEHALRKFYRPSTSLAPPGLGAV